MDVCSIVFSSVCVNCVYLHSPSSVSALNRNSLFPHNSFFLWLPAHSSFGASPSIWLLGIIFWKQFVLSTRLEYAYVEKKRAIVSIEGIGNFYIISLFLWELSSFYCFNSNVMTFINNLISRINPVNLISFVIL